MLFRSLFKLTTTKSTFDRWIQTSDKENVKTPHYWPCVNEIHLWWVVDSHCKWQSCGKRSHAMTSSSHHRLVTALIYNAFLMVRLRVVPMGTNCISIWLWTDDVENTKIVCMSSSYIWKRGINDSWGRPCRRYVSLNENIKIFYISSLLNITEIYTGPTYQLLLIFRVISDVCVSFIPNKCTFIRYCLTPWISNLPGSFEIYWFRQYLVNTKRQA